MDNMKKKELRDFPIDSYHSLGFLPCTNEEERDVLESAINYHLKRLDERKWQRAVDWFCNSSFLMGQQHTRFQWDGTNVSVNSPWISNKNSDMIIPRTVDNKLKRPVEVNSSLLTINRPYPSVTPAGPDPGKQASAAVAELFIKLVYEEPLRIPQKLRELALILCTQGTGAMEISYGETTIPERFPETKLEETVDPITGETVQDEVPTGKEGVRFRKDFRASVYNSFQIQPDPGANESEDSLSWICRTTLEDSNIIRMRYDRDEPGYYPDNLPEGKQESITDNSLWYWERLKEVLDQPAERWVNLNGDRWSVQNNNNCLLRVIDVKPTVAFPEGRTMILASKKLIYCGPSRSWSEQYPNRWHPYTIFRFWTEHGRFWGMPLLAALVPLQKKINAIDAQIALNRSYIAVGQWMIPKTCLLPDQTLSGQPGQNFVYHGAGGMKPERVENQPLPSDVYNERQMAIAAINEIAGVNQVMAGESSSQHRSVGVIQELAAKVHESKSGMLLDYQFALQRMFQNILIEAGLNMEKPDEVFMERLRMAAADLGDVSLRDFAASNLLDNVSVQLDIKSELTNTPEVKAQKAMEFLQYAPGLAGLAGDVQVRLSQELGIDIFNPVTDGNVDRVRRLIEYAKAGEMEHLFPYPGIDNAALFVDEIKMEIRKERFKDLDQERQEAVMGLLSTYEEILAEEQQKQQAAQMAAMAAAAPPGAPSGPPQGAPPGAPPPEG